MLRKHLAQEFGIFRSCNALEIAVSTYYYRSGVGEAKAAQNAEIRREIEAIVELLPQSGYRPVTIVLRRNRAIGEKKLLASYAKAVSYRLDVELVCAALKDAIPYKGNLSSYTHHTDSDARDCSNQ
jgi:hypothetical protein